jgi:hypothetical protein
MGRCGSQVGPGCLKSSCVMCEGDRFHLVGNWAPARDGKVGSGPVG